MNSRPDSLDFLLYKRETGELSPRERRRLETALRDPAFRARAEAWTGLRDAAREALTRAEPDIDPRLRSDLLRSLRRNARPAAVPTGFHGRWAWALAATAVALLVSVWLVLGPSPDTRVRIAAAPSPMVPTFTDDVMAGALDLLDGHPLPRWSADMGFGSALLGPDLAAGLHELQQDWNGPFEEPDGSG